MNAALRAARCNREAVRRWARERGLEVWRAAPYWLVTYPDGCDSAFVHDRDRATLDVGRWIDAFDAMAAARQRCLRVLGWSWHTRRRAIDRCRSGDWRWRDGAASGGVHVGANLTAALLHGPESAALARLDPVGGLRGATAPAHWLAAEPPVDAYDRIERIEFEPPEHDLYDGPCGVLPAFPDTATCAALDRWSRDVIEDWKRATAAQPAWGYHHVWRRPPWQAPGDDWIGAGWWAQIAREDLARATPDDWPLTACAVLVAEEGARHYAAGAALIAGYRERYGDLGMDSAAVDAIGPVLYRQQRSAWAETTLVVGESALHRWRWNSRDGSPAHELRALARRVDPQHPHAGAVLARHVDDYAALGPLACRQCLGPARLQVVRRWLEAQARIVPTSHALFPLQAAVATQAHGYVAALLTRQDVLDTAMGGGNDAFADAQNAELPLALTSVLPTPKVGALLARRIATLAESDAEGVRLALAVAWQRVRRVR